MKLFNLQYYAKNGILCLGDLKTTNFELINISYIVTISELRKVEDSYLKFSVISMSNKDYYYMTEDNYYNLLHFTLTEVPTSKTIVEKDDWIKINTHEDLPTEPGKYKVVIKGRNQDYGDCWWIEETWRDYLDSAKWLDIYSHYKVRENERYPLS